MALTSNIAFFGSPSFAVQSLDAVLQSGRKVSVVVTQPDRPAGRGREIKTPEIKRYAIEHGLKVIQPSKMKDPGFRDALAMVGAKVFVVAAYGRILPKAVLDIPEFTLNVHASLLPRWRGAAPVERAILAGDSVTGISIMRLVEELDAGDVLLKKETEIGEEETGGELKERLAKLGGTALIEALRRVDEGRAEFVRQDPKLVTFAPPLQADEGRVRWDRPRAEAHNLIRGLNPWPGAFTKDGQGRIKLYQSVVSDPEGAPAAQPGGIFVRKGKMWVRCGDGWLELKELQREGKSRQPASAFASGYRNWASALWS